MLKVPFNQLYKTSESLRALTSLDSDSGAGAELTHYFKELGFQLPLLTDSCTRAIEVAAQVMDIEPGDEVIVPSFGYPTTAGVFANTGVQLVFADSLEQHPNVSLESIRGLISSKTKAVVVIHYGGVAIDLPELVDFCATHNLFLIEDNAHGMGSYLNGKPLGTFGHFSATSFHQTKNIHCYSGGLFNVSVNALAGPSIQYYDKGTNRRQFLSGEVPYYEWTSKGNSCAMNALSKAFLKTQLNYLKEVTERRLGIWNRYHAAFRGYEWNFISDRVKASKCQHNAHIYAICLKGSDQREELIKALKTLGIEAYLHYNSLHKSKFGSAYKGVDCPNANAFTQGLLRLPIYPHMSDDQVDHVIESILNFAKG